MSNKPRPLDGPGANGLRGGRGVYNSGKTAIGVWLDAKGGPSGYKRGFHTDDYATEGQTQQMGGILGKTAYFGSELPNPEHLHRKPPKMQDLFDPLYSGEQKLDYMTNTKALYQNSTEKIIENHLPRSNMPRDELEQYQKTWCCDTPAFREVRYQTENRRAGNAANKNFQTPSLRLLPGTPKIIEIFRLNLIEKYGVLSLPMLRHVMGKGEITCDGWKSRIKATDIKLFPHELNQILAYFTPTNFINVDRFVNMIAAKVDGYDENQPKKIFNKLFDSDNRISSGDLLLRCDSDSYPEISLGLNENHFIDAYVGDDGMIGVEEFILLHKDIYSTTPISDYSALINTLWGIKV